MNIKIVVPDEGNTSTPAPGKVTTVLRGDEPELRLDLPEGLVDPRRLRRDLPHVLRRMAEVLEETDAPDAEHGAGERDADGRGAGEGRGTGGVREPGGRGANDRGANDRGAGDNPRCGGFSLVRRPSSPHRRRTRRDVPSVHDASRPDRDRLEDMCHELRTPINAVVGYVALLREHVYGDLNPEQGEAVERIRAAAEHLVIALRHLFEMADLDMGQFHVTSRSRPLGSPPELWSSPGTSVEEDRSGESSGG